MKPLPLIFLALIGAAILTVQFQHRKELREKLQAAQPEKISRSTRHRERITSPVGLTAKREDLMTKLENFAETGEGEMSDFLLKATAADLQNLISRIEEAHPEAITNNDPFAGRGPFGPVLWRLKIFLDELDPLAVLQSENRPEAFMALARKSPADALQWLNSSSIPHDKKAGWMGLFQIIRISHEPSQYLEQWDEAVDSSLNGLVVLEPSGVKDLLLMDELPEDPQLRKNLLTSIIQSSLLEAKGLAQERVESLGLAAEEIENVFASNDYLGSQETLDWLVELGNDIPERDWEVLGYVAARFATRDLEKAGEWLRNFNGDPSVRSTVIARYASVLGASDPEAALPWIEKIQDEQERERVRKSTLIAWEIEDPESFAAWKAK